MDYPSAHLASFLLPLHVRQRSRVILLAGSVVGLSAILAGCGAVPNGPVSGAIPETAISGTIHGGQQPVAFASVSLYAPGVTGYGSAPQLITSTTSDAHGNFTLTRPYPCPVNSGITYLLVTSGDSGSGTNSSLALAALLPACSSLTAATTVFVSEETTVAAAYALAPFATIAAGNTNIGTSSTNLTGLYNALGPANNLANTVTGNARTANELPNMVLPTREMNSLADILAACVNSNGATGPTDPCGMLFIGATPPGGVAPADTFQAAIDIALNPGNNAATLYTLATPQGPYQPTLGATGPGDFALAIQYTGGQIAGSQFTTGIGIDAAGNAWLGNGANGTTPKSVSEISPAGVFLSPPSGFLNGTAGGNGYSIDQTGHVFIAVAALNSIYELDPSGNTTAVLTPGSLVKPIGVAVDNRTGGVWVTNANNQPGDNDGFSDFEGTTVSYLISGTNGPGSPYGASNGPLGVQIDGLGNVWVANSEANTTSSNVGFLTRYTPPTTAGSAYTTQTINTGAASYPFEIAFDSDNNAWVTELNSVAKYSNSGTLLSTTNYMSVPTNFPLSVLIDGLGRAFVSNDTTADASTPGSLTVFSPTGTLISTANAGAGYLANNAIADEPFAPTGMAIDSSGNVWITGIDNGTFGYGFVTELIGIAAPVTTPTSVASSTNKYGVRP